MCGIVAMFSEGGEVRAAALEAATRSLHHRGPEAQRQWLDSSRRVGLGHARLSIINLEGGSQPLSNEDETIHAVVNGELYDFERIRTRLESQGHRFRSQSDSEVLLHLYEQHGTAMVEHLRGEFAFVLYDAKNALLIAGRDRFGIKPLVYCRSGGVLMMASEAKALFAAGVLARWDEAMFGQSMMLGCPLEDRTFFAGVSQLPPGHLLIATVTGTRLVRYWDFDFPRERNAMAAAEASERVRSALDEATRLRLRADVPVACYLSGGLDSCAVLGLAQRHATKPIRAFTLAFDQAEYDEAPIAEEMAKHSGAELTSIPIGQSAFAEDFADALWHAERPFVNANSVAKFRLSRAVRDAGIKVVLTGEGSDEIFAGYPFFRRDLLLEVAKAQLDERVMPDGAGLALDAVKRTLGVAPAWIEAFAAGGFKMRPLLASPFAKALGHRDLLAPFMASVEVGRQLSGRHVVHQSMYLWSKTMLPNFILSALGDRMEMGHSVEGRLPFLDHHVVEVARSLPVDLLVRGTVEKYVLREAMRPFITDSVYRRQKHPFLAPPVSSASGGALHTLMQETLRGPTLKALPFFEPKRVVGMLDMLPKMDGVTLTGVDTPLMFILSACLMHERFQLGA